VLGTMAIEVLKDGESTVFLDDDHLPILVVTWFGPATVTNVKRFYAWGTERVAKASAAGNLLVMINDALDAGRPGPEARDAFARHQLATEVMIAAPVVITNPLVRGAMTAVGWLLGDRMKGVTPCATIEEAFDVAIKALAQRGVKIDKGALAGYRRPALANAPRLSRF
jgi:hypothetical protein